MDRTVKYLLSVILIVLVFTAIPQAYANIPFMSPMGLGFYILPIILTAIFAMIIEVIIIVILLRKKSLYLFRTAILLFLINVISFFLFLIVLPLFFEEPPSYLIVVSEALVVFFETYVLSKATHLTILRKPQGLPLTIKGVFLPVLIGNIVSGLLGVFLLMPAPTPTLPAVGISGQGTWETTLEARDLDGDVTTIEAYYDKTLDITWLADANYAKTSGHDHDGRMNWHESTAWVASLNINGITGWRLPKMSPINGIEFGGWSSCAATTDFGTAPTTTDGTDGGWRDSAGNPVHEMCHMYYVTLANLGLLKPDKNDPSGYSKQLGSGYKNTGPFKNLQPSFYLTSTEAEPTGMAYIFHDYGGIGLYGKDSTPGMNDPFAWPVHDGDVGTAVPRANVLPRTLE